MKRVGILVSGNVGAASRRMSRRVSAWSFAAAALAIGLGGCGGGSGGNSGAPYTGSPDSGSPYGGSPAVPDGGAGSNGPDGGGDGGQVLPPYRGRIVVSPAALLFTGSGQTAVLNAQAFDAAGAPLAATFTFTSSQPDQVSVDASGTVTSMVPVGSTQITVTGAGLTSRPLLVLVVEPQPGTVLVSDAQVVAGPTQTDPTADPVPGAQYRVTLDGVGSLPPGTMLVSREGNPVAGQVVSTAPNGTHTDVVYQLPTLLDLFARLDMQETYHYDLQTAADDEAIAAMAAAASAPSGISVSSSALDIDVGPFKCSTTVAATGITIEQSLRLVPDLSFDAAFSKDANGDWTEARMRLTGSLNATGKVTAKLAPGAIASLSCKLQLMEFIVPVAGPLAFLVGPRIPVGVKAEIKGAAAFNGLELGGKVEEAAHLTLGFDAGPNGAGDLTSFILDQPHLEPIYSLNKDLLPLGVEISAALGAYASLNVSILEIGIAEAFVGAKLKYQMMSIENQVGSDTPNKYELKAPVVEIGPGSSIKKALSLLGGTISFKTTIAEEGLVIARSPFGTFTADNQTTTVPANKPVTFNVSLDPSSTSFLAISNVSGVHIYRADALVPNVLNEVKYLNGAGPTFTWTWTPKTSDIGQYTFLAATDDELVYAIDAIGVTAPFWVAKDSGIPINVGPAAGNWGGTITLSWTGAGQTTSGAASTESGSESITYVPGMPSPDGISFDMKATATTFNVTYGFQEDTTTSVCPSKRTYQATGSFSHTGADADKDAHGLLTVIPNGDSADYAVGVPGLFVDADYTDDVTSDCGTSTHNTGVVLLGATGTSATGTINRDATTISGGANYQARDGLFGETMTYTATWNLQKM